MRSVPSPPLASGATLLAPSPSPPAAARRPRPPAGAARPARRRSQAEAVYAELAALTGQERRDELVKRAEDEGALDLYTSMTSDVADAVTSAFEDAFDLDVSLYRAGSETVLQRVLQEQQANFAGNDVVETNANELFALGKENRPRRVRGRAPRPGARTPASSRAGPPPASTCSRRAGTPS